MRKLIAFAILVPLALCGCDPVDRRLTLVNYSDRLIFYSVSVNDSIMGRSPLVASYEISRGDTIWDESSNLVPAGKKKSLVIIGKDAWVYYINRVCEDSTLRVFVFDKDLITSTTWDTLVSTRRYTHKITAKVKDLEKSNWEIEIR